MGEPGVVRSGVSECERSEDGAHLGFKGRSAYRRVRRWFFMALIKISPEPRMARAIIIIYYSRQENISLFSFSIFSMPQYL
jgi:hypothetical protein